MKYLYLAVNSDGTEVCANNTLFRYVDGLESLIERDPALKLYRDSEKYVENNWCNTYSDGYFSVPKFTGVILPKGTIKMLTGRDLTADDKPFIIDCETGYSVAFAKDI